MEAGSAEERKSTDVFSGLWSSKKGDENYREDLKFVDIWIMYDYKGGWVGDNNIDSRRREKFTISLRKK